MAEDESPRHLGRADEVAVEQIVEGGQGLGLAQLAYRGREVELEGLAGHGRRVQQCARWIGEGLELPRDGSGYGRGHSGGIRIRVERGRERLFVADAAELLEVERIAAPVPVDRGDGLAPLIPSSSRAASASLSCPSSSRCTRGSASAAARRCGGLPGAEAERKQDRRVGLAAQRARRSARVEAPSLQCRSSSTSTSGCSLGEQTEQPADRAVGAVALVGDRRPRAVRARAATAAPGPALSASSSSQASWPAKSCETT